MPPWVPVVLLVGILNGSPDSSNSKAIGRSTSHSRLLSD